jgi:hypothetical protein
MKKNEKDDVVVFMYSQRKKRKGKNRAIIHKEI